MLVLMAGLPGTGKTTLARELAVRTKGRVVSKDEIRHAIFAAYEIEYSSRQDDFVMRVMLATAAYLFDRQPGRFIFLDGRTFSRKYQVENVLTVAASLHQPWRILECVCSEATALHRIDQQLATTGHPAGNRDYKLYLDVKSRFETILQPKTLIDTDQSLEVCINQGLSALR